ncbi:ABC transporter ATP-binding protein [Maritalea sp.]|jgi:multiple sugar transport system ATP-binding protein|uniref:ABC transporter ATP-binding protein n=1 Tax=Maritalea sp. TaxID=2003361 RepID=UPI0039E39447
MTEVSLQQVVKNYGQLEVVHSIDLEIKDSEFVVLVGPSGCGKSTTLRMIAGLEEISGGTIKIGDRIVNDLPPRDRNISMVFQNYALYPHMTVRDNLGFGLKIAKLPESEIGRRVDEAAEILGLGLYMDRLPAALSGGQRQRVAMGRAIVRKPDVFLFDEPLSNLDAKLRGQMRTEIKKLHKRVNNTIVYVTHDQVEAMTLADRIVIMRDGHIEQVGTPLDVFDNPANIFVASFIGSPPMNQLDGKVVGDEKSGLQIALADNIQIPVPTRAQKSVTKGQAIIVGIRPDDLTPVGHGMMDAGETVSFDLTVSISEPLGTETILFSSIGAKEVQGKMLNPRPIEGDERFTFNLSLDRVHLFDAESGMNVLGDQNG